MKPVLIIDSNFLCYQAKFTMPKLTSIDDIPTEITFGFLNRILFLAKEFRTNQFIFCWDSKTNKRKELFFDYKAKRRAELAPEERLEMRASYDQFTAIRRTVLPAFGFTNNFVQKGYESDDLIANIVKHPKLREFERIVVSSDEDLFQLLDNCHMFSPTKRKLITKTGFTLDYGIDPEQWRMVKAIAGCSTDCVPGVPGVGEKKACQYLLGLMNPKTKTFQKIKDFIDTEDFKRNLRLVSLPYPNTKTPKIKKPFYTSNPNLFVKTCLDYNFESFLNRRQEWEDVFS